MIERYSIHASASQLADRFQVEEPTAFKVRYNAAPSQLLPVITHDSPEGFAYFYWGIAPQWTKNKTLAERIINTRAELIQEKPVVKKSLMKHRCLIPADGFYGWKKVGKKTMIPWRFILKSKEIFSFAGLWEEYEDENQEAFHTFTLLTVPASNPVAEVMERMPAIFTKKEERIWMNPQATEQDLLSLFSPKSSLILEGFTVSPSINAVGKEGPSLIVPTPPTDQFGNLTLFN